MISSKIIIVMVEAESTGMLETLSGNSACRMHSYIYLHMLTYWQLSTGQWQQY